MPVAGGLYDQDPQLLEEWLLIFRRRHQREELKREKEANKGK